MPKNKLLGIISIPLALLLALAMIMGLACAPAPPAPEKPIKLICVTNATPSYYDSFPVMQRFVDRVNKSEGVEMKFYHSGELLKARELLPGLEKGTTDLICTAGSYFTGTWPIWNGFATPFLWENCMDVYNHTKRGAPLRKFFDKYVAEKHGIKIIAMGCKPVECLWLAKGKPPVTKPEDLKGLKIRAPGKMEARTTKTLGGTPVYMSSAELYEALSRGTIDGVMCGSSTAAGRALYDVLGSCTRATFGTYGGVGFLMKMDTWEKLPQDVRDVFIKAGEKYDYESPTYALKYDKENYWPKAKEAGIKIIELSPKQIETFREATRTVRDWYKKVAGAEAAEKFYKLARE